MAHWQKIDVKPCVNGLLCHCEHDEANNQIVVFDRAGFALGYFDLPTAHILTDWLGTTKCSVCGDYADSTKPFCPSCGRKFTEEVSYYDERTQRSV